MATMDRASLSRMDPELQQILEADPIPQSDAVPEIPVLRAQMAERGQQRALQDPEPVINAGLSIEERQIPTRDGTHIAARIYSPSAAPEDGSPLMVIFHGGGFCFGGLESEDINCRRFARELGIVAVNVEYRLAPENPWPVAVHDAHDAVIWVASLVEELKANTAKGFIVGGTSAGANLATVVSHLARDENVVPPLTGVYLTIPPVLHSSAVPEKYKSEYRSYHELVNVAVPSRKTMEALSKAYNPDPTSKLFSSFLWPTGHSGLPPTFLQLCGLDPLRDEGLLYEKVLREEGGVPTRLIVYPGLPHGFWNFFPQLSWTQIYRDDVVDGNRWLLEQKKG